MSDIEKIQDILGQVFDAIALVDQHSDKVMTFRGLEQRPSQHTQEPDPEPFVILVDFNENTIGVSKALGGETEMASAWLNDHIMRIEARINLADALDGWSVKTVEHCL